MKQLENKRFDMKFLNIIMYIGTIISLYFVLKNIGIMDKIFQGLSALSPVYLGIIVCWVSMPLVNKLRKIGLSRNISAIVSLIIIFGIIVFLIFLVVPLFIEQLTTLIKDLPNIYSLAVEKINYFLKDKIPNIPQISTNLDDLGILQKYMVNIVDYSLNTLQSVINFIILIATTIVVSFFMVKDFDKFKTGLINFFSKNRKDNRRYKMITEIDVVVMSYVKGMLIDSFIVGILTIIVCLVLKLDYAIVFGILIMVLNLIPYIGAILSYTITALYALTVGGPLLAIITFISLFVVQTIDANILQPNIIGKSVSLHPVIVLGGLIVFQLFWGVFGMMIAVPILAAIKVIFKYMFSLQIDGEEIEFKAK
ncbi:MAG: AI-2E family transporter [Clostridia bacterium]